MPLFACIYFPEDNSVSVVQEGHKDIRNCKSFHKDEELSMVWNKKMYDGIILEVSGEQFFL